MKNNAGFTLVELIITVLIVGILSAVAIPTYLKHVTKASRAAAQTELMQMASLQEKIYLNSNSYATNASVTTAYNGQSTGGLGWTAQSKDGKYDFSCDACTQDTFQLSATPVSGSPQANDGTLSLNSAGQRIWTGGMNTSW